MKKKIDELIEEALTATDVLIPVTKELTPSGWRFLCKVVPGMEKVWLSKLESILQWGEAKKLDLVVARRYILKDGKMAFGWYIQLEGQSGDSRESTSSEFCGLLYSIKPTKDNTKEKPKPAQKPLDPNAPKLKVLENSKDQNNKLIQTIEMPLPHVGGKDMNKPSKPVWSEKYGRFVGGEKGAKGIT